MKLYFHPMSPNVRRVLATINHLNLPVEMVTVDLFKGETKTPEFLRINPNGKIPALQDGEFCLWESNAIVQYLATKSGDESFYPADPQTRARIHAWQHWNLAHFQRHIDSIGFERFLRGMMKLGEPNQALIAESEGHFERFSQVLNNHLEGRDYLESDNLTLADFCVAASLTYRAPSQLKLDGRPHLKTWLKRIEEIDAYAKSAPPPMG